MKKVALCGVWHVHAPGYAAAAAKCCEIVGVYEENEALRNQFLKGMEVPVFDTLEELLASDAEGVIVCSATNAHADQMVKIAEAKKHIFTEKVLGLTDEECERVAKAVRENGVQFSISLVQKSNATCRAVKAVVESGELGRINYARFRNCHSGSVNDWLPPHFYNAEECGGGAMIDLGAHGMYLIHWLLGMPTSACSTFTLACQNAGALKKNADRVEDNAVTVLRYEDGAIAVNETGFVSGCSPMVLEVHGERGCVRMEGGTVQKCTVDTERKFVDVPLPEAEAYPLTQFLSGEFSDGYGIEEAKALTHLMVMAYSKVNP